MCPRAKIQGHNCVLAFSTRLKEKLFRDGQRAQVLSQDATPDQDDLTCLSWLHQRNNLLPLQPLAKMTPLRQRDGCTTTVPSPPPPPPPPPASSKPPYSFSSLIFMAIEDSPHKKLPVKDIYEWIVKNFPYYRTASGGWRNSVRHNLSLSKSFRRIQRDRTQVEMLNYI
uniref:Si:ch211-145o7.3 n=1 Tax=Oryzias melastigma TaxID=30732 RepID=A0A3B3DSF0_ORYME